MGVLEARADAEKVGYPVVGEEQKDASNVIDYNIHDEITIDTSSVFNGNNDTTTGMATVIPGVNAPKLIAETSIYGDLGEQEEIKLGGSIYTGIEIGQDNPTVNFRTFTLSNLWGDVLLSQGTYGIILPVGGWYEFTFTFPTGGGTFKIDTVVKTKKGVVIYTDYGDYSYDAHVVTFKGKVEKDDELYLECTLTYVGGGSHFYYSESMSGTILKM